MSVSIGASKIQTSLQSVSSFLTIEMFGWGEDNEVTAMHFFLHCSNKVSKEKASLKYKQ